MVLTKTPICNFEEKAHDFNLKGVDNKYPLYGEVKLTPGISLRTL